MDAKMFAIKAHRGQVRKVEPDKPLILHPINVAKILESYGYSKDVVDAGYLHDVVEDTKYTLEDIKNNFNEKVYNLVKIATDEDKEESWEVRKQKKIDKIKKLNIDEKVLICADKISNLEDLRNLFGKTGSYDFSKMNRGYDKQKWYYENIYASLISNGDNEPIFKRLKYLIDEVFENNNLLEKLHYNRNEIRKLNMVLGNNETNLEAIRDSYEDLNILRTKLIDEMKEMYW